MNCSGCGQANEAGMQFCIFCGQALSEKAPDSKISAEVPGVICTVCGKSDALNGQFCVFCGGRTTSAKNPLPVQPVRERSPGVQISSVSPTKQTSIADPMLLLLAACAGVLLGLGALHLSEPWLMDAVKKDLFAGHKFLLYSDSPYATLELANKDEQTFLFGMTGPKGSLSLDHLQPGAYALKVQGKKNEFKDNIEIKETEPAVAGYPELLKL